MYSHAVVQLHSNIVSRDFIRSSVPKALFVVQQYSRALAIAVVLAGPVVALMEGAC